jgi:hypothetical protein
MVKLATLISLALLFATGYASAQNTMMPSGPPAVPTPDQCNKVWSKAVTKSDTIAQAGASSDVPTFAQADDFTQVDANNDGTVDKGEFAAACQKGLVREPLRAKE